jgi:hypothetical protein
MAWQAMMLEFLLAPAPSKKPPLVFMFGQLDDVNSG